MLQQTRLKNFIAHTFYADYVANVIHQPKDGTTEKTDKSSVIFKAMVLRKFALFMNSMHIRVETGAKPTLQQLSRYEQRCQFSLMRKARKLLFRVAQKKQTPETYVSLYRSLFEETMPGG